MQYGIALFLQKPFSGHNYTLFFYLKTHMKISGKIDAEDLNSFQNVIDNETFAPASSSIIFLDI